MPDKQRYEPPPYLPFGTAIFLIGIAVALALGLGRIVVMPWAQSYIEWLHATNLWINNPVGEYGIWGMFVITVLICFKQMSYYYRVDFAKKTGIFEALGSQSMREYATDWALAILGGMLFPIATLLTPYWLLAFSLYALLGWYRCSTTLLRGHYISKARAIPTRPSIFSKIPRRLLVPEATVGQIEEHDARVAASTSTRHEAGSLQVQYCAILAGWTLSFPVHSILAGAGFIFADVLLSLRQTTASVLVTLLSCGLLLSIFFLMSEYSLRWGTKNAQRVENDLARGRPGLMIVAASSLAVLAVIQAVASTFELPAYVSYMVRAEKRALGTSVHVGWFAPGMTPGLFVSPMNSIWRSRGFTADGINYWTIGWMDPKSRLGASTRFDPLSTFYQAWFGIYLAHSSSFIVSSGSRHYPVPVIGRLAELDQAAWLRLYGDPHPEASITKWRFLRTIDVRGHRAEMYYGEIRSHADISPKLTRYIDLLPRGFSGPPIDQNALRALFVPDKLLFAAEAPIFQDVTLRGYFVVVPLQHPGNVACIYASGVRATLLSGDTVDTFPIIRRALLKMIESVSLEPR